jgi:hypothetical protein
MLRDGLKASDYLTGDTFELRRTEHGWWATTPAPANLSRYYPPAYRGQWMQSRLYARRVRWIAGALPGPGVVLDVGCGPGHLLAEFQQQGWRCVGNRDRRHRR